MSKIIISIAILASLLLSFCVGGYVQSIHPKIITKTITETKIETFYEPVYIDKTVTEYVNHIVYKESEPITRIVTAYPKPEIIEKSVYRPLREFESLEVLKEWLGINGGIVLVADASGYISFNIVKDGKNDCDDQAKRLQEKAINDGYNMSLQVIDADGFLCNKQVNYSSIPHMGNLACIGNDVYFVESGSKEVVWISYLD